MSNKNTSWYVPKLTDSDELWKIFIKGLLNEEAKAILMQVNSNSLLRYINAPEEVKEKLWIQICKCER